MTSSRFSRVLPVLALVCLLGAPARTIAQESRIEVGASLVSAFVGLGDDDVSVLGVPTAGFGLLQPGIYGTFFIGPWIAVEPQLGLFVVSSNGHTEHAANVTLQVDYFVQRASRSSPFVFASGGVIDFSGPGETPAAVSAGAGYRFLLGDRLVMRVDGRYTHYTKGGGNVVAFTLAIGGLFR